MSTRMLLLGAALLSSAPGTSVAEGDWGPGDCDIIFSEVHYHPAAEPESAEYIELYNDGVYWVDLGGWRLEPGIAFTVPPGIVIPPRGFLVVARDAAKLSASRGITNVIGNFEGALGDSGERLELRNRGGRVAAWIHYRDGRGPEGGLWPEGPDGDGPSLELLHPHPDWQRPWYWAASRVPGGTPGRPNSRGWSGEEAAPRDRPNIAINEAMLEGPSAFVELINRGSTNAKLEGLKLTGDPLGAGGLLLSGPLAKKKMHLVSGPRLAELGPRKMDVLFLLEAGTLDIVDVLHPRPAASGSVSTGRYPDGAQGAFALPRATPGAANVPPPRSPVVLSEVLYHGLSPDPAEEFIELHNSGKKAVSLRGWKLGRGASFEFPEGAEIPADGHVVVAGDPEKLRGTLPAELRRHVYGPLRGKLSNSGETISLDDSLGNRADQIRYSDRPPWPAGADGGGFSIELLHPGLDNAICQAWTLGRPGGSPCRKNSRSVSSMPPIVAGVTHDPAVPSPEDQVVVHARVLDTGAISQVAVVFRDAAAGSAPQSRTLADSGDSDDGAPHDGHHAAKLPRFRAGTLIGFHVVARDRSGRTGRSPEKEGDEYFFQVEAEPGRAGGRPGSPVYRVLMPPEEWGRFQKSPRRDDTWFPCTLIASIEGDGVNRRSGDVFHGAEIRFRGNSSRNPPDGRMSYRIRLSGGALHDGRDRIILNAFAPLRQKLGGDILRAAGLTVSDATVVRLKAPTIDDARYVDVEVVNNEFLDKKLGSSSGDLFRGLRGQKFGADLAVHGTEPGDYLAVYRRVNKKGDDQIPRLLELLRALGEADDASYPGVVRAVVDVPEWAMYFAANNVLGNTEGGLSTGQADDYFLAERSSDGRFLLVPWDQDSTFDSTTLEAYPRRLPATDRFLRHPQFAPEYHRSIRELLDGPLAPSRFRRRLRYLEGVFDDAQRSMLEQFVGRRQAFLREHLAFWPRAMVLVGGEPASSAGLGGRIFVTPGVQEMVLAGYVDPSVAHGVSVGEAKALYDAARGSWTMPWLPDRLQPGPNPIWIASLDARGGVARLDCINLEKVGSVREVPPSVSTTARWTAAEGPYVLGGAVTVEEGATLEIGPGTNIVCAPDAVLVVRGRLFVDGAVDLPVTFRPREDGLWAGIRIARTGTGDAAARHVLRHCRFEGGRGGNPGAGAGPVEAGGAGTVPGAAADGSSDAITRSVKESFFQVEGSRISLEACLFRGIRGVAAAFESSVVEVRDLRVSDCGGGLCILGGQPVVSGARMWRIHGDALRTLDTRRAGARFSDLTIQEALGRAIAVEGGSVEVENALVVGSGTALHISGGAEVRVAHLTAASCGVGVQVEEGGPCGLEMGESILWPCRQAMIAGVGSRLRLSGVLAGPRDSESRSLGGEGMILAAPAYVAPERGDFRLKADSPGKKVGAGSRDAGHSPAAAGTIRP